MAGEIDSLKSIPGLLKSFKIPAPISIKKPVKGKISEQQSVGSKQMWLSSSCHHQPSTPFDSQHRQNHNLPFPVSEYSCRHSNILKGGFGDFFITLFNTASTAAP
jgi:hypothetical protein